jgi:hypothetical protein
MLEDSNNQTIIRFVDHFETGGDAVLRSACKLVLEGIVSKRLDAPYRSGRSGTWTKAKCRAGQEVVIGGWTTTNGRFRSLLVGARGDHFAYVGRVGARKKDVRRCKYPQTQRCTFCLCVGSPREQLPIDLLSVPFIPKPFCPAQIRRALQAIVATKPTAAPRNVWPTWAITVLRIVTV